MVGRRVEISQQGLGFSSLWKALQFHILSISFRLKNKDIHSEYLKEFEFAFILGFVLLLFVIAELQSINCIEGDRGFVAS
jgi:hypothetical protein